MAVLIREGVTLPVEVYRDSTKNRVQAVMQMEVGEWRLIGEGNSVPHALISLAEDAMENPHVLEALVREAEQEAKRDALTTA